MEELTAVGIIFSILAAIIFFIVNMCVIIGDRIKFPIRVAEIQEIRMAVDSLGCIASEDVLGKAATINSRLASYRGYNNMFFVDIYFTDRWNTVSPIKMPNCNENNLEDNE